MAWYAGWAAEGGMAYQHLSLAIEKAESLIGGISHVLAMAA